MLSEFKYSLIFFKEYFAQRSGGQFKIKRNAKMKEIFIN